jgi:phosphate acetyltransferase
MKGSLHSDEILGAVIAKETGPEDRPAPEPRLPHGRPDVSQGPPDHGWGDQHRADARGQGRHLPERHRPLPHVRRRASQGGHPRGVETVNSKMPATLDAGGAVQDGRSAARSGAGSSTGRSRSTTRSARKAAKIKGIVSEVAGDPDVLLAPTSSGEHGREAAQLPREGGQRRVSCSGRRFPSS